MKGGASDLFQLVLILQIILTLKYFDVSFPANWDSFIDNLQKILNGEYLSIEFLIRLKDPFFSFGSLLKTNSDASSGSVIANCGLIFTEVTGLLIVGILTVLFLLFFKSQRKQIQNKVDEKKKEMVWSGIIKILTIKYLFLSAPIIIQAKRLLDGIQTGRD